MINMLISLVVVIICAIILKLYTCKTNNSVRKHPKGDYVLKIIINKKINDDLSLILNLMKDSLFKVFPSLTNDPDLYAKWRKSGEAKIVLVGTSENMQKAYEQGKTKKILVTSKMHGNEMSLLVVGPGLKSEINEFTSDFRLF
ncbi:peptidyl-tRNA hydrolase [Vairimorpha necatrix]|uniref:peptidyl-tRNA hydrolase n=1 Tax=Vairimorpha necatrix TaxID=6039 RepID=A0AAX4JAB4_9MICR